MRKLILPLLCALGVASYAWAQTSVGNNGEPVTTYPFNTGVAGTNHATLTLPLTNNLALAANAARHACTIQYRGSNTVSIATNSSMNDPLVLPAPTMNSVSVFQCGQGGTVIGDPLYITGTSSDTVVLWWQ